MRGLSLGFLSLLLVARSVNEAETLLPIHQQTEALANLTTQSGNPAFGEVAGSKSVSSEGAMPRTYKLELL